LYSFVSCAAPKLYYSPNKRDIYIYIYEFVSISHETSSCVCVGSFEELNLNMLENNIQKTICKFCIDDDDDDDS